METEKRLAVLIDGDNIPSAPVKEMMQEIAKYGNATIKRIYADWTQNRLTKWKNLLLENAISPVQQYGYTSGKNATDSAMIIDAMDILYSGRVDGFCIVSSDSDFTRLALRMREAGMYVIGIGEKKTPQPFIVACDKFIYLEILKTPVNAGHQNALQKEKPKTSAAVLQSLNQEILDLIADTVTDVSAEDGWAFLGDVGSLLIKKQPNFDPRNFGFPKLKPLIQATAMYEIEERTNSKGRQKLVHIRLRQPSISE